MECINCTQCIDACNLVMKKIGREPDLIRYSSQARDHGQRSGLLRARTIIYPLLLAGIATAFFSVLLASKSFDAVLLREPGNPHTLTDDGRVRNLIKLKLTNRSDQPMTFTAAVLEPEGAQLELREDAIELPARGTGTFHVSIIAPRNVFVVGRATSAIALKNQDGVSRTLPFQLIGPYE